MVHAAASNPDRTWPGFEKRQPQTSKPQTGISPWHRQILKKIVDTKTAMGDNLRASAFALTEAKYAAGDFRHTVLDNVDQATVKVGRYLDTRQQMTKCREMRVSLALGGSAADRWRNTGTLSFLSTPLPARCSGQGLDGQCGGREDPEV